MAKTMKAAVVRAFGKLFQSQRRQPRGRKRGVFPPFGLIKTHRQRADLTAAEPLAPDRQGRFPQPQFEQQPCGLAGGVG